VASELFIRTASYHRVFAESQAAISESSASHLARGINEYILAVVENIVIQEPILMPLSDSAAAVTYAFKGWRHNYAAPDYFASDYVADIFWNQAPILMPLSDSAAAVTYVFKGWRHNYAAPDYFASDYVADIFWN
jgi:hypothetical protein